MMVLTKVKVKSWLLFDREGEWLLFDGCGQGVGGGEWLGGGDEEFTCTDFFHDLFFEGNDLLCDGSGDGDGNAVFFVEAGLFS